MANQSTTKVQVEERFKFFVRHFVKLFEKYFEEKFDSLFEKNPKKGKTADWIQALLGNTKSGAEALDGPVKAGLMVMFDLLGGIAGAIGSNHNWKKVKEFAPALHGNLPTRKSLVRGAGEIFEKFEAQFMNVTSQHTSWQYNVMKIAEDAVYRVVDYLRQGKFDFNLSTDPAIQLSSVICTGLLRGESKKYSLAHSHKGHTIKIASNDITTKDMFENFGVKIGNKYYHGKKLRSLQSHWIGYRLAFDFDKILDEYNEAQLNDEYDYVLDPDRLKALLASIETEFDEETWTLTEGDLDNLKKEAKAHANEILSQIDKIHDGQEEMKDLLICIMKLLEEPNRKSPDGISWTVEEPVPMFSGREGDLNKLHEAMFRDQEAANRNYLSHVTVVCGMGGVGKTQMARKYAHKHKDSFPNALWVEAESESSVKASFKKLAEECCGMKTRDDGGKEKEGETIAREVYQFFGQRTEDDRRTLIIMDNADQEYDIRGYLPRDGTTHGKVYVLITSQDREWFLRYGDTRMVVDLDVFNDSEAFNFINENLGNGKETCDESNRKLTEALHNYPLALEQAISYIKDEQVTDPSYSIASYLEAYAAKRKSLLDDKKFQDMTEYKKTTYTTWQVAFDRISKDVSYGELACQIMNTMALLAPENINPDFFYSIPHVEKEKILPAIRLIVKYSMAKWGDREKSVLSVHRLVQEVTRLWMVERGELVRHLGVTVKSLCSYSRQVQQPVSVKVHRCFRHHFETLAKRTIFLLRNEASRSPFHHGWFERCKSIVVLLEELCSLIGMRTGFGNHAMNYYPPIVALLMSNTSVTPHFLDHVRPTSGQAGSGPETTASTTSEREAALKSAGLQIALARMLYSTYDLEKTRETYRRALNTLRTYDDENATLLKIVAYHYLIMETVETDVLFAQEYNNVETLLRERCGLTTESLQALRSRYTEHWKNCKKYL